MSCGKAIMLVCDAKRVHLSVFCWLQPTSDACHMHMNMKQLQDPKAAVEQHAPPLQI